MVLNDTAVKSAYTTRHVPLEAISALLSGDGVVPRPGDLVIATVREIGQHRKLELRDGRRSTLYRAGGSRGLVVTHRPQIVELADAVWELDDGKVRCTTPQRPMTGAGVQPRDTPRERSADAPSSGSVTLHGRWRAARLRLARRRLGLRR